MDPIKSPNYNLAPPTPFWGRFKQVGLFLKSVPLGRLAGLSGQLEHLFRTDAGIDNDSPPQSHSVIVSMDAFRFPTNDVDFKRPSQGSRRSSSRDPRKGTPWAIAEPDTVSYVDAKNVAGAPNNQPTEGNSQNTSQRRHHLPYSYVL